MANRNLTDAIVQRLSKQSGQKQWRHISDGACRGLSLRISPRGEKVWAVRLQVGHRRKRHILGAYPEMSLEQARQQAKALQAAARSGISPAEFERRRVSRSMTVALAHEKYLCAMKNSLRARTLALKQRLFDLHIGPLLGPRPLRDIRRSDVLDVVTAVVSKGHFVQANRVFSELMALLRWAEEFGYVSGVPAIKKSTLRGIGVPREQPRTRVLTDAEVAQVWRISGTLGQTTADYVRLLLLTGQRSEEVRVMTWNEVDLEKRLWTIPAERYKTWTKHVVPLSEPVLEILKRRWQGTESIYVLHGRRPEKPFNGAASAARRLRAAMGDVPPFVLHDLRRTVRTGLSWLDVDAETAERVIGHLPSGIARVYDLYDRLPERRKALETWANHVRSVNVMCCR